MIKKIESFIEDIIRTVVFMFFVLPYLAVFILSGVICFVAIGLWEIWERLFLLSKPVKSVLAWVCGENKNG